MNNVSNQKPAGLPQPLEIPLHCWDVVSTDFFAEILTTDAELDAVLVAVSKQSKRAIFKAVWKSDEATHVAQIFQYRLSSIHGVQGKIISDRESQFTRFVWESLMQLLSIKSNESTAHHPQSDRQSKNMVRIISNMLRGFTQSSPKD